MKMRTHGIQMTNEARLLRKLRMEKGLSLRTASELFGKSASYLAQVENGRMKPPTGESLDQLLEIYGGPKADSFYRRAYDFREKLSEKEEIVELLQKTNPLETSVLLKFMRALVA